MVKNRRPGRSKRTSARIGGRISSSIARRSGKTIARKPEHRKLSRWNTFCVVHLGDDESGDEIARGLTNFSSDETMVLARNADQDVQDLLGYQARPEIINRDNMVILEDKHILWDAPTQELRLVAS